MENLDYLNLTNEQKTVVDAAIEEMKNRTQERAEEALDDALAEQKTNFKASVVSCKKPETYDSKTDVITRYLAIWEPFRRTMNLNNANAVSTFMTYLDKRSSHKVVAQGLHEERDWEAFKGKLTELLTTPTAGVKARYQLMSAKQQLGETVTDFVQRLTDLGDLGFKGEQNTAREYTLKDALTRGLILSNIAERIIDEPKWTFKESYQFAIRRDAAHQARKSLTDNKIEVTILKTETSTPIVPSPTNNENGRCYNCGFPTQF